MSNATPAAHPPLTPMRCALAALLVLSLAAPATSAQVPGTPEDFDAFGFALAVGDFDGDGEDDLAIGAYSDHVGAALEAGSVTVVYGRVTGIDISNAEVWSQDTPGVIGVAESGDWFGWALAVGDFDGDGYDDLAVGAPGEDFEGVPDPENAGVVHVLYGSATGLTADGNQLWDQSDLAFTHPEDNDQFGETLTAGDFDGDGFDDLAVGTPSEDISGTLSAGVVHVLFGRGTGLTAEGNEAWYRTSAGHGPAESDRLGDALAAGDFDGDGFDDLAVGMPGYGVGADDNVGGALVLYGTATGMAPGPTLWSQATPGIEGVPEQDDFFGWALAAGDFDGDGHGDLAVGVPGEDEGSTLGAGAVNVIYGSASGLTAAGDQIFTQNTPGIDETSEDDDGFGTALAAGRIDGDAVEDLAIGVPFERDGGVLSIGTVVLIAGRAGTGLDPTLASVTLRQGHRGIHDRDESGDSFGRALAFGRFDGAAPQLAIGAPYESIDGVIGAGAVNVVSGALLDGTGPNGAVDAAGDLLYQGYDLRLSITPLNPPGPVVVVEQGGRIRFRGALTRLSANHAGMDYWTVAITPSGSEIGPLLGPGNVQVPAGGSGSATFNQRVANNETTGLFAYELKVGYYPDEVLATAVLPVQVVSSSRTSGERLAAHGAADEHLSPFLEEATPAVWVIEGQEPSASAPEASSTVSVPETAGLQAAYPNPFQTQATLGFSLPEAASVRLSVFDALGREVAVLVDGARAAGVHRAVLDGAGLPSGIYLVRFEADRTVQTQRLTLAR